MQYAGMILNDITAADGLSVSFFVQGCPHHCAECHNPETWDFLGGKEFTTEVLDELINALNAQGIQRNFCLMGGEPLCEENIFLSSLIISTIKSKSPTTPIYVWTGYTFEELQKRPNSKIKLILDMSDFLIDGPYVKELRDVTLKMRGSSNQNIIDLRKIDNN